MKAEKYKLFSRSCNLSRAYNLLLAKWLAANEANTRANFKQPVRAIIEAKADELPVAEYEYDCEVLKFSTESVDSETYPVAIVMKADGWLETVPVCNLQIMEK